MKQGSAVHCTCNVQRDVTMHQQRGDCRGPATTCKVRTGVNISRCKKMMNEEEINSAVLKKMSAFLNLLPLFSFDKEVIFATVHLDLLRVRTKIFFFQNFVFFHPKLFFPQENKNQVKLFFFFRNFFFSRLFFFRRMWYQVKKKKSFRSWTWMIFRVFLFFFYENSLWKYVSPEKDSLNFIHENKIQKSLTHEKNFSGKQHFCHFHTWNLPE